MKRLLLTVTLLIATAWTLPAQAAKFANQFTEFELPPQWQCNLEGAEWVCQSTNDAKKRDAIIVLAAKLKGDQDSLDQYLTYLKGPKSFQSVQGKAVKSEVKFAKHVEINGHAWADALHLDSEIPGFYTRYLATIKSDIGVLVTYSISKNKYQEYINDFDAMVKTLKVFRKPGAMLTGSGGGGPPTVNIPSHIDAPSVFGAPPIQGGAKDQPKQAGGGEEFPLFPVLAALALIGYFVWKKRQSDV